MSVVGNVDPWKPLFPDRFVPDILDGVRSAWKRTAKPCPTELETRITRRLRHELSQDARIKPLPLRVVRELVVDDPDTAEELGRIDLCLLHGHEESVYFAFECKRLNVPFPSGMKSLAGKYVGSQGMMCFVTGKYADGHEHGGMIGFVMSGDVETAIQAVRHVIEAHRDSLLLTGDGKMSKSSLRPDDPWTKETVHRLEGRNLTLHHVFLS